MNGILELLPNRISKTLSAEKKARIHALLLLLVVELGPTTQIPEAVFKKLAKLGDKNKILYDLLKKVMDKYPDYINGDLPIEENTKDKVYFEDLESVRKEIKDLVMSIIDHEQGIAGAEYRNAISIFEDNVALKAKRKDEKAILIQDEIDNAYKEYEKTIANLQDAAPKKAKVVETT
jgi:hypothetical protein